MYRCETLVVDKLLEEQSLRISIRDLLEFEAMEECTNITCVHCRYLELVRQKYQTEGWSGSEQQQNARQKAWSETREREHFMHGVISGII
jgi:hypothetical protein